ncbi:uncharacterized protein B0H18DRAFT_1107204, partial [Fomitopsis serialis]|uniref:uncharacterized protein n=1 Tax=Fomitopsis serialis TaxID=139415 RepID=UPI002007A058
AVSPSATTDPESTAEGHPRHVARDIAVSAAVIGGLALLGVIFGLIYFLQRRAQKQKQLTTATATITQPILPPHWQPTVAAQDDNGSQGTSQTLVRSSKPPRRTQSAQAKLATISQQRALLFPLLLKLTLVRPLPYL